MKRVLLGAAAVAALLLGGLMTSTAEAHGPRGYYGYGHRPHCSPYQSFYGGYGGGYVGGYGCRPYVVQRPYCNYYGGYSSSFYYSRPGISVGFRW